MDNFQHQATANGRWFTLSLCEQLGNVGSEVGRAVNWQKKANLEQRDKALLRGLELLDLTITDKRWKNRLKELCRAREVLCDTFWGNRLYADSPENLEKYFYWFALAARAKR